MCQGKGRVGSPLQRVKEQLTDHKPKLTKRPHSSLGPQVLLLLIMLLVAAGLVGLDIQWEQEWHSLRVSLQVSGQSPVSRQEPWLAANSRTYLAPIPPRLQVALNSSSQALRGKRGGALEKSPPHQLLSTGHSPIPSYWSSRWNHPPGLACG